MAATGLQHGWIAVTHGTTSLKKITDVSFKNTGKSVKHAGDADLYTTVVMVPTVEPTASVTTGDVGTLMGLVPRTLATFTATHKDALGATNGDIVYVLANAMVISTDSTGKYGAFSSGTLQLESFSSDGTTNPLTFTRA